MSRRPIFIQALEAEPECPIGGKWDVFVPQAEEIAMLVEEVVALHMSSRLI